MSEYNSIPHSTSPYTAGREEVEKVWSEVKLGKKGRVRGNFLRFGFISRCSTFFGKKLNLFAPSSLFCLFV